MPSPLATGRFMPSFSCTICVHVSQHALTPRYRPLHAPLHCAIIRNTQSGVTPRYRPLHALSLAHCYNFTVFSYPLLFAVVTVVTVVTKNLSWLSRPLHALFFVTTRSKTPYTLVTTGFWSGDKIIYSSGYQEQWVPGTVGTGSHRGDRNRQ